MKDNWMLIAVIVLAGFTIITPFVEGRMRKKLLDELAELLMSGRLDEFDQIANTKKAKRLIRPFNLDFMKLNGAIMKGNKEEIEACLDRFENVRLNTEQKSAVYNRAFYYYLTNAETEKAETYYKRIAENRKEDLNDEVERLYDTYVLGGFKYLQQTEEAWEQASENMKPTLEALLAKMYENKGDIKQAEKYTELLKKRFEQK